MCGAFQWNVGCIPSGGSAQIRQSRAALFLLAFAERGSFWVDVSNKVSTTLLKDHRPRQRHWKRRWGQERRQEEVHNEGARTWTVSTVLVLSKNSFIILLWVVSIPYVLPLSGVSESTHVRIISTPDLSSRGTQTSTKFLAITFWEQSLYSMN